MEKQVKQYKDMTTDEKAQAIYNFMLEQSPVKVGEQLISLDDLLMDLSIEYDTDTIFTMNDWLEYEEGTGVATLIRIGQRSKGLNVNDDYIRESLFYSGYKTANSVIDLVDEGEAVNWIRRALNEVNWIRRALNENDITVGQLDNMMELNE